MILFIVKSSLCLTLFIAIYYLFLEREKMHVFNRFYLLFTVVFSLIIPNLGISFGVLDLISNLLGTVNIPEGITVINDINSNMIITSDINNINADYRIYYWIGYLSVAIIFLYRFIKNLYSIYKTIRTNDIIRYKKSKLVLLDNEIESYTFLNYIFLNKTAHKHNKIVDEVLTHEITHVNQKHTIDVIFLELIQILFWFNPIFIIYKRAIKLNHEFIADNQVVNSHNDIYFYQELLINTTTIGKAQLTSNFNFNVTKKRLIMMTTKRNRMKVILKKIGFVPVLFLITLMFSHESYSNNGINQNGYLNNGTNTLSKNSTTEVIQGTVSNEEGKGLPGTNIVIKGTSKGVRTNNKGEFAIKTSEGQILVVSFKGYQTQEVKISNQNTLNITLKKETFKQSDTNTVIIRGAITNKNGEGLAGTAIVIKGTSSGAETDYDGNFAIKASVGQILVISYKGYQTQEVKISNQKTINITLKMN